ncbi:MAG: ATP-binding cassette domain-containing protein [Myxococcales bacterium]|nr:ATP-binding cassette domain-containing protein [Myxococcales bacterium]
MSETLVQIKGLTVRFGGLTAVDSVDLSIEQGSISAVIGPNGAGKTTLFNAIAGLAPMTEGSIQLGGAPLTRSETRRHRWWWALCGLGFGLVSVVLGSNPDKLWAVTIRGNYVGRITGFSPAEAARDAVAHLAGEAAIERRAGRYYVTLPDGKMPFGSSATKAEARERRQRLTELGSLAAVTPSEDGGRWVLRAGDGRVLDEAVTQKEAQNRVDNAKSLVMARSNARMTNLAALILGAWLGFAGVRSVWRQQRRAPSWIAQQGVARTFQNIRLFSAMTVRENVMVALRSPKLVMLERLRAFRTPVLIASFFVLAGIGARFHLAIGGIALGLGLATSAAYLAWAQRLGAFSEKAVLSERADREKAGELLAFVGLGARAAALASELAYGDRRRLEIARALATEPRLLLLDEPAAGMNPTEARALMELIRSIRARGITVLLIEHHMQVVMGISDHIAVLDHGRKIAEGTPDEVRRSPAVIAAYLGQDAVA